MSVCYEPESEAELGEALPLALGEAEVELLEHRLERARLPQVRLAVELCENLLFARPSCIS
jgi:hypothetical protein